MHDSPSPDLVQALLAPRAVALIGASGDATKNTARPQRFLEQFGYAGAVYPINPRRSEVLGLPAYASVAAVPGPVDHALIMVPAGAVPAALEDCGAAGVRVATVYSDGFAEAGGDGPARQRALLEQARRLGVRVIGPNSMGVIDLSNGLMLTVSATFEAGEYPPGPVSVLSQSGTMLGALLSRGAARGVGFSKLISVGNESDLGVAELIDVLVADPHTEVITLFLETIRSPLRFAAAARRAYAAGKPVVAYLLGQSDAGRELAVSHSGALAGSGRAAQVFLDTHGVLRVDMLESLFEITPLLRGRRPARGRRAAIITTTGGGAATVADRLGGLGVALLPAPPAVVALMAEEGVDVSRAPIVDLTMAGTRPGVYGRALVHLLASEDCDAVVTVVGSSAQHRPDIAVEPIVAVGRSDKPVAAFMVPEAPRSLAMLAAAGVPAFRTPEACADALNAYLRWQAPQPQAAPEALPARAMELLGAAGGILDEAQGLALFEALGVPVVAHRVVPVDDLTHDLANDLAHDLDYPLVAKLLSAELPHKSSAGAVTVGITDAVGLRDAVARMLARVRAAQPAVHIDGVMLQRTARGLGEVIVGLRRDPAVGAVVTVGVGGVLTEIYADSALAMAPVDRGQALALLDEVRGLAPLRGYRNLPRGDLAALADVVVAVSRLALAPRVREAEINPVMVLAEGDGVLALDALVVLDPLSPDGVT